MKCGRTRTYVVGRKSRPRERHRARVGAREHGLNYKFKFIFLYFRLFFSTFLLVFYYQFFAFEHRVFRAGKPQPKKKRGFLNIWRLRTDFFMLLHPRTGGEEENIAPNNFQIQKSKKRVKEVITFARLSFLFRSRP